MRADGIAQVHFPALAGRCELLLDAAGPEEAIELGRLAAQELWRIEAKFSREQPHSIIGVINRSRGARRAVDRETAALLDHAARCHRLSGGAYDVTAGVLHRSWPVDRSGRAPAARASAALLPRVGFAKVHWRAPVIALPAGMEIDLDLISAEYAVDRVLALIAGWFSGAVLVHFAHGLAAHRAPADRPWQFSIDAGDSECAEPLRLYGGALATRGELAGHSPILDARTGWPVADVPRSVTVAAGSCAEAGMLAQLALLKGSAAESFLAREGVRHWCRR